MRRQMTDAEAKLWRLLRNKQLMEFKFRRQQPIGRFIADFVCYERRLIVEADGSQHCENEADVARTAWLERQGFRVLRFWNRDVLTAPANVIAHIYALLTDPSPRSPLASRPLPQGEREESAHHAR